MFRRALLPLKLTKRPCELGTSSGEVCDMAGTSRLNIRAVVQPLYIGSGRRPDLQQSAQ